MLLPELMRKGVVLQGGEEYSLSLFHLAHIIELNKSCTPSLFATHHFSTVVSNFIQKVDQSQEIFSLLTQLACKQIDGVSCYTAIQDAIGYCYQGIENCLGRMPCDCALDFIAFVERLETDDNAFLMQSYTKLDDSSIGIIKGAEFSCR